MRRNESSKVIIRQAEIIQISKRSPNAYEWVVFVAGIVGIGSVLVVGKFECRKCSSLGDEKQKVEERARCDGLYPTLNIPLYTRAMEK